MRYFKNTVWMMVEKFLRIIAGLSVGIWVARYLGPEQFGLFSYVLAFTAVFSGIAKLGLDGVIVRELINHPEKHDVYLGTTFWLKVIGAFIGIVLIAAIAPFTSNNSLTNLFIFIIAIGFLFQSFEVVEFYFQSEVFAKVISICKIIQLLISSIVKIYLVIIKAELIYFVLVTTLDVFSLAISYYIAYRLNKGISFYNFFNYKIAFNLIKLSFPMMISTLLITVYMKSDIIMIKSLSNEYSVGIYSVGTRLVEAIFFLPTVIIASVFPSIINAKKVNNLFFYARLQSIYTVIVWIAIIFTSFFMFFSKELILILFGENYIESSDVLFVYSLVIIPLFLSIANDKWFYIEEKGFLLAIKIFSGALCNIFLNYLLIPKFGVIGAAYSTVISFYVSVILSDIFIRPLHKTLLLKINAIVPIYLLKNLSK